MVINAHSILPGTKNLFVFCLLLLVAFPVFSQDSIRRGTIRVRKQADALPHIAGKKGGAITAAELCNDLGIQSELPGVRIIHFVLTYYQGGEVSTEVEGNRMPDEFCKAAYKMKEGAPVGIERILAMDSGGRKFNLNPMRFTIVENKTIEVETSGVETGFTVQNNPEEIKKRDIDGMYKLVAEYVNLRRTYIKLFNDSLAYIVESVDDPVVLDQFLLNRYKREGRAPGKYSFDGKTINIVFENSEWNFDYTGTYSGGGLDLKEKNRDGKLSEMQKKFAVLPFSQKN